MNSTIRICLGIAALAVHALMPIQAWSNLTHPAVELPGLDVEHSTIFFDRQARAFFIEARVTNNAVQSISGPIMIVVKNSTIPVDNADGINEDGLSYFTVLSAEEKLARGESSTVVRIQFPLRGRIRPQFKLGSEILPNFVLQVLHSSDNESSFQDPNTLEPKILNYSAVVEGLREFATAAGLPSLHVTAGDHVIPGPFYQASGEVFGADGLGDIRIYNAMHLAANGIGNHEFDGGINDFSRMLAAADYPFIAANLDFSQVRLQNRPDPDDEDIPAPLIEIGIDGASVEFNAGKVVKSAYIDVNGERVGLIGRAPADFFNVIADPDNTLPGLDFVGGRHPDTNQPLEIGDSPSTGTGKCITKPRHKQNHPARSCPGLYRRSFIGFTTAWC